FGRHAVTGGHLRVIDEWLAKARADMSAIGPASADAAHVLNEHQFLMPGAVVVHDGQHRQLVMRRRPEDTRRVVEIAVGLDIHDEAIPALRGKRSTDTGGSTIAHTAR